MEENLIQINDDDIALEFNYNGKDYIAIYGAEYDDGSRDMYFAKIYNSNEDYTIIRHIDSDMEYKNVLTYYNNLIDDLMEEKDDE